MAEELWPVQLDLIGPAAPIPERSTYQMTARVTFDDNSQREVTSVRWTLPNSQYGSITTDGLFTAGSVGSGSRTVQVNGQYFDSPTETYLSATTFLSVRDIDTPPALVSISIAGPTEVDRNTVETYVVSARYADGSIKVVVPTTFTSSRSSVATIGVDGIAHFQKIRGSASVRLTATFTEQGQTVTRYVDVLVVDSSIYPVSATVHGPAVLMERECTRFSLDVLFDDGGNREVAASWYSTNPKAGEIDCNGVFRAHSVDAVEDTIIVGTFVYDDLPISASIQLSVVDVTVAPVGLEIEGPSKVREGLVVSYYTTLVFNNGTRKAVNAQVETTSVAGFVDDGNMFHAASSVMGDTPVNLMAIYGNFTAYKVVEVVKSPVLPTSCYIELRSPMYVGEYQALKFHVVYADGTDLVLPANWSVSNENIAEISASGVLHAMRVMETAELLVRASLEISGVSLETSLPLTIIDVKTYPVSISIQGPDQIRLGTRTAYTAVATFNDGSTRPVSAKWVSEDDVEIRMGAVTAKVPGKRVLYVFYTLQHETVSAIKEIDVL